MEKRKDGFLIEKGAHEKDFIFGTRAVMESIHAGKDIDKVLVQKDINNDLIKELIQLCKAEKIPVVRVPDAKLNRITRKNHQGVVAQMSAIEYASLDHVIESCFNVGKAPLILVLDRITDVRNFGAIARTAECAGVDAIVIPEKGSAQINSDAIKTSAGALNFLPVVRVKNLFYTCRDLQKSGLILVAITEKTDKIMYEADFSLPVAMIMGSEEDGISNEMMGIADEKVKIPMAGKIESLNVSVSAGVAIYEAMRQRA
ncbi:23S rRNA (guanosine(2251)-2'-O)-methyltransferase RlmB [Algoriphagus halophytocola]|uniref:23S rRNA (Guanosine(2251)-2'-O)-methyltransferase RlmB n=1 Tax=Algoriphagus halophytocola TaxID=2991499 RepID=A0ABY6MHP1_9BACT|nr:MULTISPECIES: 23S rRNA (guanosine(2251)-2'-O)-methyltransferase RlmB [unclassified Algoriphagus]UZD22499.1 23S rRNA (guanosine(2251)-2'-O)-methyltransferase RlmB [Algoriphagus sp. TR-M5]WBL43761.1 23S rRNA (guanosine(2251)-2'-O)-methyltransferase RlmB [Algoriphagus sp. TR-M9]